MIEIVPALMLGSMQITVEHITPDTAKQYLGFNESNRNLRMKFVKQYACDMKNNDWHVKPLALCFLIGGALGNGQHTLNAIIESGVSQTMLVARNCTKETVAAMDRGAVRTVNDISHFTGNDMTATGSAIAKTLISGIHGDSKFGLSYAQLLHGYTVHKKAIEFVLNSTKSKEKGLKVAILSVCARAYYTQDREKIARFLEILRTGVGSVSESGAIKLREIARENQASAATGRKALYDKAQTALVAFLAGRPVTKLYATTTEVFQIPEDRLP